MAIGAILGLAGSISTKIFGIFEKREERKTLELRLQFEEKRLDHEKHMFALQSQENAAETEREAFLLTTQGSFEGLKSTIDSQTKMTLGSSKWVINFVTLMRPLMTISFIALVIYLSVWVNDETVRNPAILAGIDLALMASTWWFGDRSTKRVVESMRGNHLRAAGGPEF